jgi:hypothetical protein
MKFNLQLYFDSVRKHSIITVYFIKATSKAALTFVIPLLLVVIIINLRTSCVAKFSHDSKHELRLEVFHDIMTYLMFS